ncbi:MAG: ASPIC/UnbV domain-containing protein, partial [Verrucomicrobiota bacterium]
HGGFESVPGQVSGVKVYGEQRGAAVCDYDHDGRVDLVVAQNGAATKLFRNTGAKPGLRVRLAGPPANQAGVGATIRLQFGDRFGPAREIHAGSGYWSQDGAVQVMGIPVSPTHVQVRWPGGKAVTSAVAANASEISIDTEGRIRIPP